MSKQNSNSPSSTILVLLILGFLGYAAFNPSPASPPAAALPTSTRTPLETALYQTPGIMNITTLVVTPGESTVDVYVEAAIAREFNTVSTAATMHRASIRGLSTVFLTFSCILDDGTTAVSYAWSNATDSFTITPLTSFNATRAAVAALATATPEATIEPTAEPTTEPTAAATLEAYRYVSPSPVMVQVTAASLTVRSAPSATAAQIGQVKRGNKIIISGVSSDANWYYFLYYDKPAWITSDPAFTTLLSGETATLAITDQNTFPTAPPTIARIVAPTDVPYFSPTAVPVFSSVGTMPASSAACSPCPHSCDAARAMGCTAVQAAACPGLDRDKDGVACYGE